MKYRAPSIYEIEQRLEKLRFWIGAGTYAVVGLGGYWLAERYIKDNGWFEIFTNVWWLPSGALSWYIAIQATSWITVWVPVNDQPDS